MIVPMKKISLIIKKEEKESALTTLRELGIVHMEITEGGGNRLDSLKEQTALLENALYLIGKANKTEQKHTDTEQALSLAAEIAALSEKKKGWQADRSALLTELEQIKDWGEVDPNEIRSLQAKGIELSFYEMPRSAYRALPDDIKTVCLGSTKRSVRFVLLGSCADAETEAALHCNRLTLPKISTAQIREQISKLEEQITEADQRITDAACCTESMQKAIEAIRREIEFETYATGMADEDLSDGGKQTVSVAYFEGYIEAENLDRLKQTAADCHWGLTADDPCAEDNVPTKLKNNKFVSLIYPLTDFLGTVPGYFEYDISGWFLAFILIFFGIIFGDGGYGLLICAAAAIPIAKSLIAKKEISPMVLLIALFGLSTVLWGTLTCTWFGLSPEQLPNMLKNLSVPVISNVYADKLWSLPWTDEGVGLTTAQNLQIFCFTLALIQLTVAHIMGAIRYKSSAKMLGDIGSILQLCGIYYLVLNLVVNAEVFPFGLVLGGIPIGTVAISLIGVGFLLSFVFSNYEGSIVKSLLASLKNIVSVLLGVVNVFSDIVSYIRLWAVGLAGAAISATVNSLAGPLLGNFMFMILAIVLLVFGHGLNMILNVLSVIVHGIRLNTLEFSSHLDMSWSGHKFTPFR